VTLFYLNTNKKMLFLGYLYLINLKIDFKFNKPETNAQAPQNTHMIAKLIIQLAVNDLDNILKTTIPTIKTNKAIINLIFTLNLNIL
jgi:hypothetical protein